MPSILNPNRTRHGAAVPAAATLASTAGLGLDTRAGRWARFAPTLGDAVFLFVLLRVLQLGATGLFNDPGTGWHLRTGEEILSRLGDGTHPVPRFDTFSWTRWGKPWVETQWLGDVILAAVRDAGGYPLIALVCALVIAALFRWIYVTNVRDGAWPVLAMGATILGAAAASEQFLARPLLATMVGIPVCYSAACRFAKGAMRARGLIWLVAGSALWANIHPGVLGGIATVTLVAAGVAIEAATCTDAEERFRLCRASGVLVLTVAAMAAATLLNPYGLAWHGWVCDLMSLKVLPRLVEEWKQPDLSGRDAMAVMVLLGLSLTGLMLTTRRLRMPSLLVIVFWLQQAMSSGRHLSILGCLLAVHVGADLSAIHVASPRVKAWASRLPLFSADIRGRERAKTGGGASPLLIVAALGMVMLTGARSALWRDIGPPQDRFPPGLVEHLRSVPPSERMFNDVSLGGFLIQRLPDRPVFVDDRFDLYGDAFIEDYQRVMERPWEFAEAFMDREGIGAAVMRSGTPLDRWLTGRGDWRESYRDATSAVFIRRTDELRSCTGTPSTPAPCDVLGSP